MGIIWPTRTGPIQRDTGKACQIEAWLIWASLGRMNRLRPHGLRDERSSPVTQEDTMWWHAIG
ncbi:hypothetical protein Gotur_033684 [Gossypium turneri]